MPQKPALAALPFAAHDNVFQHPRLLEGHVRLARRHIESDILDIELVRGTLDTVRSHMAEAATELQSSTRTLRAEAAFHRDLHQQCLVAMELEDIEEMIRRRDELRESLMAQPLKVALG